MLMRTVLLLHSRRFVSKANCVIKFEHREERSLLTYQWRTASAGWPQCLPKDPSSILRK